MNEEQDIAVLREMVRLAEDRRTEALEGLDRVNRYNLALIAFSGSFLSLLVSIQVDPDIVQIGGIGLIISIFVSLATVRPQNVPGGALEVTADVQAFRAGTPQPLRTYLIDVADLTNIAAASLNRLARVKKRGTIISAIFLAFSLAVTYILYAYA